MKKVTTLGMWGLGFYLLMSASALAAVKVSSPPTLPPYTLDQFQNDTYRDYTVAELTKDIGADSALLNQYLCNGDQENETFTIPPLENARGDSLRVRDTDTSAPAYYRDGNLYALDGSAPAMSDYFQLALTSLIKIESLPSGRQLIARLERARYPVYIMSGTNRFEAREENGQPNYGLYEAQTIMYFVTLRKADDVLPFHEIGVGGIVHWDPNLDVQAMESDGQMRVAPLHVTLAHEMYHGFDSVRGILDQRFVDGTGYESEPVLEYRAVYFENQIRKESGVLYRRNYSSDETGSMLDANGNPILIPSACLTTTSAF
jgi:hypothetical protein